MTKRWVICTNDYPYVALPEGATEEAVDAAVARLNKADQDRWCLGSRGQQRVYYHAHELPEVKPEEVKLWLS